MEENTFDALAKKTRLSEKNIAMAKRILVQGESYAAVARDNNVSRQRAKQVAERMVKQAKISQQIPENWKVKVVVLPHEWVDVIGYIDSKVKERKGVYVRVKRSKPELDDEIVAILAGVLAGK